MTSSTATEGLKSLQRPRGVFGGLSAALRELFHSRWLLKLLILREIKARYKNSYLGIVWSLLRPIVQLAIYYIFIGQILGAARSTPDFAIFVFTNLTIWSLFSETVSSSTASIVANAGLVKKVYLPRELFPVASLGTALFNFIVQFVVLLTATIVLGAFPLTIDILRVLPAILIMSSFGLALGLALGAANVFLRDVEHLVEVGLLITFWASPILYSYQFVQNTIGGTWLESVYVWNPLSLAVMQMQHGVWVAGSQMSAGTFWPQNLDVMTVIAIAVCFILLVLGQRIFSRVQGNFAQEL